jgi:hypothetical protein
MQIALVKIDHTLAGGVFDVGIPDVPFLRDGPVKDLGTGWDLSQLKRHCLLEKTKALPNAVSSDASTDGIKGLDERIRLFALL